MSMKQNIETGEAPALNFLECMGSLNLKGSDQPKAVLKGEGIQVKEKDSVTNISAHGDLKASVPADSNVDVRQVHGDMSVKGLTTDVVIGHVNGNLSANHCGSLKTEAVLGDMRAGNTTGPVVVETVSGDMRASRVGGVSAHNVQGDFSCKSVTGDVKVDRVAGEISLRKCEGDISIREVMGDAHVRKIEGTVTLESVMGDLRLGGGLNPGKHHIKAFGDVLIRWPEDHPVQFLIEHGGEIHCHLPVEKEENEEGSNSFSATIGDGAAVLIIEASGDVVIKPYGENFEFEHPFDNGFTFNADLDLGLEDLGERISTHIEALTGRLSNKFGPEFTSKLEGKIEKAVEKAASKLEKAQFKVYRPHRGGFTPQPPKAPKPPKSPKEKAVDQGEQLKILEMLEAGTINVEDAATLLKALE